jgi:DNA-directed RNA polymerase specialized sigma24 family protein
MASTEAAIGRNLRRLFDGGAVAGLTDAQLLERVARRGVLAEAAFQAIMTRHGTAVLASCRRVLGDSAAAEDAFQAAFLVLLRHAGSIRVEGSVAPWLLHVAHLAALKARQGELRRRAREVRAANEPTAGPEVLRSLRAIAALERVGTPPARKVLERRARGDAAAPTTRDAAESLLRLSRKRAPLPHRAAAR